MPYRYAGRGGMPPYGMPSTQQQQQQQQSSSYVSYPSVPGSSSSTSRSPMGNSGHYSNGFAPSMPPSTTANMYQSSSNHSPSTLHEASAEQRYEENDSPRSATLAAISKGTHEQQGGSNSRPTKRKVSSGPVSKGDTLEDKDDEEDDTPSGQKRKKKAVSCESCRRRKLKCDRGWPCGACRDRNESHLCKWEGGTRPQTQGRDQENTPLLVRMDRIEGMLGAIAAHVGLSADQSASTKQNTSGKDAEMPTNKKQRTRVVANDPCNSAKATCAHNKSMLVTSWRATSIDESRSELLHVLSFLPESTLILRMCKYYFDEVNYMHYAINTEEFSEIQMRRHADLRRKFEQSRERCLDAVSAEDVQKHLQFVALVSSVCGLCLLFSDQDEFADVADHMGMTPAYGPFFDNAQRALNASNYFEEPTLMSLRVLILQLWAISAVRGPALSMILLSQALHQMFALELDHEPPQSAPSGERADRLRLFHTLLVIDWFSTGSIKQSYTIREEPAKHPYLFRKKRLHDRLRSDDSIMSQHQWLKLELARINRRGADRSNMSETEAYNVTIELQNELDEIYMSIPTDYRIEVDSHVPALDSSFFQRIGILVALSTQLISLHKRYYIQGWLDINYRASRDICFTSARRICSLFRKVFSYDVPIDKIMEMDTVQLQQSLASKQKSVSRLWFMAHASVSASLLLQHHYALMAAYPDAAGPNAEQVRREIVDDLRITKRLLLALSPHSQIARAGVAILTKPEMPKQVQEEMGKIGHGKGDYDNGVDHQEDEATRKRRAKLAMDLQSIIDIDPFNPAKGGSNSRRDSQTEYNSGPGQESKGTMARVNRLNGITSDQSRSPSYSRGAGGGGAGGGNTGAFTEMEALLQSTLSTDMYTGLPLAPEVSFQRQSDRIGLTQPYLPSGLLGPMSPATNALIGSYEASLAGTAMNGNNNGSHLQSQGDYGGNLGVMGQNNQSNRSVGDAQGASWF